VAGYSSGGHCLGPYDVLGIYSDWVLTVKKFVAFMMRTSCCFKAAMLSVSSQYAAEER
jgi:hypothetical protein